MGTYQDSLKTAQKKVQDLLTSQDQSIEPNLAATKSNVLAGRAQYGQNVNDLLGGLAGQYGLSGSIQGAGNERVGVQSRGLDRQLNENLDRQKMSQKQRTQNLMFNSAFDNFVNAGQDTQTAYANARNIALTQNAQDFQASEAAKNRDYQQKRQNISNQYQNLFQSMQPNDPYEQAVMASLFGAVGQAGTAYALGAFKSPSVNPSQSNAGFQYNDPSSLRANSLFGYRAKPAYPNFNGGTYGGF